MTEKLQVVARFKSLDNSNPRFTRTASLEELMVELMKTLPVDLIYYVIPHEDGAGYSLREAGVIVLDLFNHREGQPSQESTQEPSSLPVLPPSQTLQEEQQEDWTIKEHAPTEVFHGKEVHNVPVVFGHIKQAVPVQITMPFVDPPKSQSQLLAERGIEDPKVNLAPRRKKKAKDTEELADNLPNPVSKGQMKITRISTATPAEAARASHFGQS